MLVIYRYALSLASRIGKWPILRHQHFQCFCLNNPHKYGSRLIIINYYLIELRRFLNCSHHRLAFNKHLLFLIVWEVCYEHVMQKKNSLLKKLQAAYQWGPSGTSGWVAGHIKSAALQLVRWQPCAVRGRALFWR